MSKNLPDQRPFWLRAAEENLRQGYTLVTDEAREEARWEHLTRGGLWQDWRRVPGILEHYAAAYPDSFRRVARPKHKSTKPKTPEPTPAPLIKEEEPTMAAGAPAATKPIVLTKPWYRGGELVTLAGISRHTWKDNLKRIPHRKFGKGKTCPIDYSATGVQAFLASRGIEAELQLDEKAVRAEPETVPAKAERAPEQAESVEDAKPSAIVIERGTISGTLVARGDGAASEKPYQHYPVITPAPSVLPWDDLPEASPEPVVRVSSRVAKLDINALEDRLARAEALMQLLDDHVQEREELAAGHVYLTGIIREDLTAAMDLIRKPIPQEVN